MAIFEGQAEDSAPIDLSDEALVGQAEEQPQEETMQESPEAQTSTSAESEADPENGQAAQNDANEQLKTNYHTLLQDYNRRNAQNNRTIADLRAEIRQLQAAQPPAPEPELDPEIAKIINPFLQQAVTPVKQELDRVRNELNARKEQENRQLREGNFNRIMSSLPEKYPEVKGAAEQAQVLAEAVKISTMSNNPQLYLEYPDLVINMAVQNLYAEQRKTALSNAVNAAAEQARAATMQEKADKESSKSGLTAQSVNNRPNVAANPTPEDQILTDIMNAQGSGLFN